jgi:serine O-acetyltransferase
VIGAGAKVLGPFKVHDGARIGSNAVVVKEVSAGTTVVGIPGRPVNNRSESQKRREAIAEKMGFDAYGATEDMPDPVANSINRMLDHIDLMDQRLECLCAELKRLGGNLETDPLPKLNAERIDCKE